MKKNPKNFVHAKYLCLILPLLLTSCVSYTEEERDAISVHKNLLDAEKGAGDEIESALSTLATNGKISSINLNYLISTGASDQLIVGAIERGADPYRQRFDPNHSVFKYSSASTPYFFANAFQTAISGSNPNLALKIAKAVATRKNEYADNKKLMEMPSIVKLATGYSPKASFYPVNDDAKEINETVSIKSYFSNPAISLLFRHATAINIDGERKKWLEQQGASEDDIVSIKTSSWSKAGKLSAQWVDFSSEKQFETVNFIREQFGNAIGKKLPFCIFARRTNIIDDIFGASSFECAPMTPTQLAGYTQSKILDGKTYDFIWKNPGKLDAYVSIGGNKTQRDRFGNNATDYASNGGQFSNQSINLGKAIAATAVIGGGAYLASEGLTEQGASLIGAGLTDIGNDGKTNNLGKLNASNEVTASQQSTPITSEGSFSFSCPMTPTKIRTVPITGKNAACKAAQRKFAKAAGCNLVDEMEQAQRQYYSQCAGEIYAN